MQSDYRKTTICNYTVITIIFILHSIVSIKYTYVCTYVIKVMLNNDSYVKLIRIIFDHYNNALQYAHTYVD